jgi:hypothetical protein
MIIETHSPIFDVPADSAGRKERIMNKITKWLLISVASVALGWSVLSTLYTYSVSEELKALRKESHSDVIYLRCHIRELESELTAGLLDRLNPPASPTGGEAESLTPDETVSPESDDATEALPEDTAGSTAEGSADTSSEDTTVPSTEAVTLPTHQSPEIQAPSDAEPETVPTLYLVAERDGIIGLFDASGELIQTVNVFVMTLPETDREALAVGIPASSWQEACEMLGRYS